MRGYWAQAWRSVLVWLELGPTERLYLKGAEDLDRKKSHMRLNSVTE
jgi:hypothetical protein